MPIRQGQTARGAVYPGRNLLISEELDEYAIDYANDHQDYNLVANSVAVRLRGRAQSRARARVGHELRTYKHDFYYRFYVTPKVLALGAVVPPQTREVVVWNAWPDESRFLNALVFDPSSEGFETDAPALPYEFRPLAERTFNITVTSDVPSAFEVTLTFDFDEGYDPIVLITGSSAVVFPFNPDWMRARFNETFAWKTTVERSYAGREARSSIRRDPRMSYAYTTRVRHEAAQALDNLSIGWASRMLAMPEWHRRMTLTANAAAGASVLNVLSTAHTNLQVGGQVLLWSDALTYEVAEVLSFTSSSITLVKPLVASWDVTTRVMATAICAMSPGVSSPRVGTTFIDMPINVDVSPRQTRTRLVDQPADYTYEGYELYLRKINWRSPMQNSQDNNESRFDVDPAFFNLVRKGDYPFLRRTADFMCKTLADADALYGFFCRRRGMQMPVWLPSEMDDFTLVSSTPVGGNTFDVRKNMSDLMIGSDHPLRQNIVIRLRDGTYFASKIASISDLGGGLLRVSTVNPVSGVEITPSSVKRFSYLGFYRLSSDEVTFAWATNRVCEVRVDFVALEVPEEEA